ncbi:MAG TPA: hypothetical protein VJN18_27075 [Polyangiaceae bacterium]|nr:hypothetical protein [Polyangiaceae bacterium]
MSPANRLIGAMKALPMEFGRSLEAVVAAAAVVSLVACTAEVGTESEPDAASLAAALTAADCPDGYNVIQGTSGDDVLIGTSGGDCIVGGDGDDVIDGRGGNDFLFGGDGADTIYGRSGSDALFGEGGDDQLDGAAGADNLDGGDGDDILFGEGGADVLRGRAGNDYLDGAAGNDDLAGGDGDDELDGGAGVDLVAGDAGDDFLLGGAGADSLQGGDGRDEIAAGAGRDSVDGGAGNDVIDGGPGRDALAGGDGNDAIEEGFSDTVSGGRGADGCAGTECEVPAPTDCTDDSDCTAGRSCLPSTGTCVACSGATSCDDGNACTLDDCSPTTGCSHDPVDCGPEGEDTTPPVLLAFSVSSLVVDTSSGPATVTVQIEAQDDLSGFGSGSTGNGSIDVRHSSGTNPVGSGSLPITGGTPLQPIFELTLTFPQFSQAGTYPIQLQLLDNVFNTASFDAADLAALGLPSSIAVSSVSDTTPPSLISLSASPLSIDTSSGPATVTVRIEAQDDVSGFGSGSTGNGSIDVRHSSGANPVGHGSLPITAGTLLHPIFDLTLTFPQFSQAGTYPIQLHLLDNVFNTATFDTADLAALGLPSSIEVSSVPDRTPPELVAFSIAPLEVDTSTGPATVFVHIEARDDLSGFNSGNTGNGSLDVRHSSGVNPVGTGSLPLTGGTALGPTFDFTLTIPAFSPTGTYPIHLQLVDNVFNDAAFDPAALSSLGFPSSIEVH